MGEAVDCRTVRFGVFEADLETGELRKEGAQLALQIQPFQVLAFLLKHSGELVTREQLRSQIWPDDTFVDFDHALNTAIAKIRVALGDDPEHPTSIETLPRRGYRFLGLVEKPAGTPSPANRANAPSRKRNALWFAIGVGAAVVLVAALASLRISRKTDQQRGASRRTIHSELPDYSPKAFV